MSSPEIRSSYRYGHNHLADRYELPPIDWDSIRERPDAGIEQAPGWPRPVHLLADHDQFGRQDVIAVRDLGETALLVHDRTRGSKGRDPARIRGAAMSVATREFDLVAVARIDDPAAVADMARRWADGGWP
ncbi:hypothetical protein [Nocardia sp. NPDC049707]|uniref:hypothetical protein n=1 Tax=Nocardia sp. NPDC049707 TaxID=3154735 RepID=UPI003435E9E8